MFLVSTATSLLFKSNFFFHDPTSVVDYKFVFFLIIRSVVRPSIEVTSDWTYNLKDYLKCMCVVLKSIGKKFKFVVKLCFVDLCKGKITPIASFTVSEVSFDRVFWRGHCLLQMTLLYSHWEQGPRFWRNLCRMMFNNFFLKLKVTFWAWIVLDY